MNVLMIQQRTWAKKIGTPIATHLKANLPRTKFAAVIAKPATWRYIDEHPFHYEYKWMFQTWDDEALTADFERKYAQYHIDQIEEELGIDSVWKRLIHVERLLVNTPAKKLRYSWDKQLDDQTMLKVVQVNFGMVIAIFQKFSPDIIFTPGFGSLFHNILYHYARRRNVDMWMITATKLSGRCILENDKSYRLLPVANRYHKNDISEEAIKFSTEYISQFRETYIPPENYINRSFSKALPWTEYLKLFMKHSYRLPGWLRRVRRNSRDPLYPQLYRMLDNLPIHLEIRERVRKHLAVRKTLSMDYCKLRDDELFLYFPLHYQPEISTNLWATYFTNQIEVARQVAMGLPGRYTLYVKEHPSMVGKRDPKYHKKLFGLPNVKVIHPYHPNHKVVGHPNCKAVVCLSGTTGFEAILMQKPVIILSDIFYSILPHCFKLTDLTKLTDLIGRIETIDLSTPEFETALIKYVAALKEESFESDYASMWGLSKKGDMTSILDAILAKTLETEAVKYPDRRQSGPERQQATFASAQ